MSPGNCVRSKCDERHGDALGRCEAILAVENHAVAAVEHQHCGAGALILPLRDHQVLIVDVDAARCVARPAALDRVEDRGGGVEIHRVAELVWLRRAASFDAGRQIARVVPAGTAVAKRSEQIAQRLVAEEVERLVGDLELDLSCPHPDRPLCAALTLGLEIRRRRDVARLLHALDDLLDQLLELLRASVPDRRRRVAEEFLDADPAAARRR